MEQAGITRIGVFHFGRMDKSDPIRSLRAALGNVPGNELAEVLVVIPEAFNIRGNYFVENERISITPSPNPSGKPRGISGSRSLPAWSTGWARERAAPPI